LTCKIIWTPEAETDLNYWKSKDKQKITRIIALIESIKTNPKHGIGKPEHLKYKTKNIWSRRIDKKHRLVYLISEEDKIYIIQCRFHYQNS